MADLIPLFALAQRKPHEAFAALPLQSFLQAHEWATADGALDRCKEASAMVAADLYRCGLDPTVVWGSGFRAGSRLTWDAHPDWRSVPTGHWVHYVVRADATVIDVTAAQFGSALGRRPVYSWRTFRRRWMSWGYAADRDGPSVPD